jgi:oligosaccharide repeat unit polymerase
MKINKSILYILCALAAGLWYFSRLAAVIKADFFTILLNYLFMAAVVVIGIVRFGRFINPISVLAPLLLAFTYYGLMISERQEPLAPMVVVSYYAFVCSYVIGCLVPYRFRSGRMQSSARYCLLVGKIVLLIALLVFLLEAFLSGGLPLLTLVVQKVDSYADMKLIPVAHYFVMLCSLLPAVFYYAYKENELSGVGAGVFSLLACFILLNSLSRQLMIFGVIAFYVTYTRLNAVNEGRLLVITGVLATVLFLGVGEFRIGAIDSSVSSLDYLKAYSAVSLTLPVNTFEVTYNLYTSMNFNTFSQILKSSDSFYFGAYTFRPFLDISQINNIFSSAIPEDRDTFKMLGTIIADPYLDFGVPGVVTFAFVYGWFGTSVFLAHVARMNIASCLLWASFSYVMVMAVFTNFFNVFFIWICFALCALLFSQPGGLRNYGK